MTEHFDIAVIGAGPGGLGAAANAAKRALSHILFEKREVGNTVFDYQLRKHVMAEPGKLPLRAHVPFLPGTRESVLAGWNTSVKELAINLRRAEVTALTKQGDRFSITSTSGVVTASRVVLAIGMQGTPRTLGVPGDDLPHVAYTLADPDAFSGAHITVVGAGDAAIENALALCEHNTVSLVNRGDEFSRAKDANNALITKAIDAGKIACYYNAAVARVEKGTITITTPDGDVSVPCDQVIARIGALMPRKFVESCGVAFANADHSSPPIVNEHYETNVPGLYIIGALIGYPLIKQAINQGHEVVEHIIGNHIDPADQPLVEERLAVLEGDAKSNLAAIRAALPLFTDLTEPQFREMIIDSTVHRPPAGEVIFKRNDYTDTFFSVIKGEARIELPDRRTIVIPAGNYFGEMGLISGRRRTATVLAGEGCVLLETPRKQILKLSSSVESVKREIDQAFMLRTLETAIFPEVARPFLKSLVARARAKTFKKGEALFREGDIGDVLFVIRRGSVKIVKQNTAGQQVCQTYLPAGNFVGEMALLSERPLPRSASAIAAVACETIIIEKKDFQALLQVSPDARIRITQMAEARRIENLTAQRSEREGALLDFMMKEGISDAENVLLIDSDLCVGCDNCEHACAATHGGNSRLDRKGGKSFASIQIPISCRHCENPLCMTDCPPDALTRLPDGEVVIRDSCIGCGNCARNCPYGVIQMVHDHPPERTWSLLRLLGVSGGRDTAEKDGPTKAAKCDMCVQLSGGPACVRACPTGAAMRVNPSRLTQILSRNEDRRW